MLTLSSSFPSPSKTLSLQLPHGQPAPLAPAPLQPEWVNGVRSIAQSMSSDHAAWWMSFLENPLPPPCTHTPPFFTHDCLFRPFVPVPIQPRALPPICPLRINKKAGAGFSWFEELPEVGDLLSSLEADASDPMRCWLATVTQLDASSMTCQVQYWSFNDEHQQ